MNVPVFLRAFVLAKLRSRYLSRETLWRLQDKRGKLVAAHAAAHAQFYQAKWQGFSSNDWRNLPTIDREDLRTNFSDLLTVPVTHEQALSAAYAHESGDGQAIHGMTAGLSSGTSGSRGLFLLDEDEQSTWAGTVLGRLTHAPRTRPLRVALFLRASSQLYDHIAFMGVQLRHFPLSDDINATLNALKGYQPHILAGPPSMLVRIAREVVTSRTQLTIERVISVAELLDSIDRMFLQDVFNVRIEQIYQCTEGFIAATCTHGRVHIQEDVVAVQEDIVDVQNGVASPIVTDLWRRVQPIVRYRLDDLVRFGRAGCGCGSPFRVIEAFEGRLGDAPVLIRADGTAGLAYPGEIGSAIVAEASDLDYEVVQAQIGCLGVRLSVQRHKVTAPLAGRVQRNLRNALKRFPDIEITVGEGISLPPPMEKRRRVRRETPRTLLADEGSSLLNSDRYSTPDDVLRKKQSERKL